MTLGIRMLTRLALGVSLGCLLTAASAVAAPVTFTWDPGSVGLTSPSAGMIGPANNFTAIDSATITLGAGGFTEIGSLRINNFLLNAGLAPDAGLQTNYSLMFGFTGAGGVITVPGPGDSSTAPFTSLNYTLYGLAGAQPPVSPTTDVSAIPGVVALAYGSLVSGTATLTNVPPVGGQTGPLFSAKADLNLTLNACTAAGQGNTGFGNSLCTGDESAFFADPLPQNISLLIGDFSASTSVTTLSGNTLTIDGGGGNLTIDSFTSVPEPASLACLGIGMLTLGLVRRRRPTA